MYRKNKIRFLIGSSAIPLANARGSENFVQVQFRLLTRAALKISAAFKGKSAAIIPLIFSYSLTIKITIKLNY
jgi:hypothetical protein